MKNLIFIIFLIFSSFLNAQSILISGKVIIDDSEKKINLDNILVENITTDAYTKTNENGLFSIKVNFDDELRFKFNGLQERILKVSNMMIEKGFIDVHLNIEIIELKEIEIKPLKKYWKDNIGQEETQVEKINKSLGINEEFKKDVIKVHLAADYLRLLKKEVHYDNVMKLINQFSNKDVQTYKPFSRKKPNDKYEQIIYLKNYFTEYYFKHNLNIPKGKIIDFIYYCFIKFDFEKLLKTNNYDEIIFVLEEQAPFYIEKIAQKN